eukprot:6199349-Pleurochrysis_carterae.AAC.1
MIIIRPTVNLDTEEGELSSAEGYRYVYFLFELYGTDIPPFFRLYATACRTTYCGAAAALARRRHARSQPSLAASRASHLLPRGIPEDFVDKGRSRNGHNGFFMVSIAPFVCVDRASAQITLKLSYNLLTA